MEGTTRRKSDQLKILESLNTRIQLTHTQQQYLLNLKKGFEGEQYFDKLIQDYFGTDVTLVKDRLITYNGSTAQVDALIVIGNTLYLYEVKNFEGEYLQLSGHFRRLKGQEFICPSIQLNRAEKILRQVLSQWTESLEILSFVIFVNPAFTLYDAKVSNPFILPAQITGHFEKLKNSQTQPSKECLRIIKKLQSESRSGEKYRGTPQNYVYEDMRKGLTCNDCHSFNLKLSQRQAICRDCGRKCSINDLIFEHIKEVSLLFPDKKITTAGIFDWVNGDITIRRIRTYFKENYVI